MEDKTCVGAFNVANMVMKAIQAAEELRSPLILQIAEVRLNHSLIYLIGPLMVEAGIDRVGDSEDGSEDIGMLLKGINEAN